LVEKYSPSDLLRLSHMLLAKLRVIGSMGNMVREAVVGEVALEG
jgi:hypothetical protein